MILSKLKRLVTCVLFYLSLNNKRSRTKCRLDYGAKAVSKNNNDSSYKRNKVAFISILPPENSGIATYSLYSCMSSEAGVDLFCPVINNESFNRNRQLLSTTATNLFPLSDFFDRDKYCSYKAIILAFGASDHHAYFLPFLKELSSKGSLTKVVVYLHDLHFQHFFLHHFANSLLEAIEANYYLYNNRLPSKFSIIEKLRAIYFSRQNDTLGLRFFRLLGIKRFLVNSDAAANLLKRDLGDINEIEIKKIFLPVISFSRTDSHKSPLVKEDGWFYIGSFGIPSMGKCTPHIIRAIESLNMKGIKVKLVLAGWGVNRYLDSLPHQRDQVIAFDSLDNESMLSLMKDIDLAVQLRIMNGGESSGCIPMLFSSGTPTLVSNVGSFSEYGDEVYKFNGNLDSDLADFVLRIINSENKHEKVKLMKQYIDTHSSNAFMKKINELYS